MEFSLFLTVLAAAIGFLVIFRKFRFNQENKEIDSSLQPPSSPPSSSSVHPASSSHNWTHDVFPSFRGEDIRRDFLSHIQKEFRRKGITPFIDNEINRGKSIGPELIRAIRESKIAIILLSKNYASSKWCLDELVEIMKCKETVIPVFYKVDPSHVKKLTGYFGKVFKENCVGKSKEDIGRWKEALDEVSTIAGYHSSNWDNEAVMIEEIVTSVSKALINSVPSSDFDNLVGMRAHMEKMEPFLGLNSNEVKMIGIWGPSGIGKSTIARVLFSQNSHEFQFSVFMENIKSRYPRPFFDVYSTKMQLQKEFLSQIINQEDVTIRHLGVAKERLKNKKVFIVLDDVDHLAQLDAMVEETRWFGPGSRIIVTTQNKELLDAHAIKHIYKVDFPPYNEALQIFCMYTFGQKYPYDGFENLSMEVTNLAGKLPLGLRIMGSYFKGMPKKEWEEELPRLRIRLDGDIESILRLSYDALGDEDQALFLHIACFFNNEWIVKVEEYLAETFVGVKARLRILAEKSLISMESGYIKMHSLLARLGREIVRKQSPNNPGQRQFLVEARDIYRGSQSVIGIDLTDYEFGMEWKISDETFERMFNVQFLRVHCYPSSYKLESLNRLPQDIRLLYWIYFPLTCLPSDFNPEFLVEINMSDSNLEKLWEGNKAIRNLKWMDLCNSKNLKELPDFSTATNLQKLDLSYCSSLVELPSSIGSMTSLENLDLSGLSNLVELPYSIGNMTNLKKLHLKECSSLVELPSSIGNMTNLKELHLKRCSSLVKLPYSIGNMTNLKKLHLKECSSLLKLPSSIGNMTNFEKLNLKGCSSLQKPSFSFGNMTHLKKLDLTQLYLSDTGIQEIASWVKKMSRLKTLVINGCTKLVSLPQLPDSLEIIHAENCESLERLDCSFYKTKFTELSFVNCFKLNQEARNLILKASTKRWAVFPGETVPAYFSYRATGSSVSMKLNGLLDTRFPTSLRFKACLLLVTKPSDVDAAAWRDPYISYCIKDKLSGVEVKLYAVRFCQIWGKLSPQSEHLVVIEFEETVSSPELVFEFSFRYKNWEIKECGLRPPESLALSMLMEDEETIRIGFE
ncbi:probable disease resistance protein RPP1 isoform X2 [Raphanus sativus]|uniref:ADP-ribosyl cyclase/cyclic ADP-ribose hydrolase n=1 Tax=Raphanus sativus TaxID=3726 RepID=A0A9W3CA07_RAPSA|nr:probable disease resistance protein RPP1 isoform X2 [Raphanus sativus]